MEADLKPETRGDLVVDVRTVVMLLMDLNSCAEMTGRSYAIQHDGFTNIFKEMMFVVTQGLPVICPNVPRLNTIQRLVRVFIFGSFFGPGNICQQEVDFVSDQEQRTSWRQIICGILAISCCASARSSYLSCDRVNSNGRAVWACSV